MYSVLIVDDERLVIEAIKYLGNWEMFEITDIFEAQNVKSALKILSEVQPDIIITDMNMPGMSGMELLRIATEQSPRTKLLVVSGFYDYEYTRQAIKSKVIDYILKPISEMDLNLALSTAVQAIESDLKALGLSVSEAEEKAVDALSPQKMDEIAEYLEKNYHLNITLDELAKMFYFSREHLSRAFKKAYRINLFDYITNLRLEESKKLMAQTTMSLEDIAIQTGFNSGSYFSKTFKKRIGLSPKEYRTNCAGGNQ